MPMVMGYLNQKNQVSHKKEKPSKFEQQLEQLKVDLKQAESNEERAKINLQIRHIQNILKCLHDRKL
jgi:hypothetical protein